MLKFMLHRLYRKLHKRMREQKNRDLPFCDLLFDRYERANDLGFSEGASIYQSSCVFGDVQVGEKTWIGPNVILDGSGGLTIGKSCCIGACSQIYTHDSVRWALSGAKEEQERAPVSIGDCCFIGPLTVIAKGVTISDHCVIGACSYVDKDIPSYTVAFGRPAVPVRKLDPSEFQQPMKDIDYF
ncbi:MAG: acyltransferase [Patescibacteria group bacterium]